eukprot:TRINITY_DN1807_c0_g1_i10.p5 TRINITY_DN1807_c0_g1~~TRINITY_DN1807_c0_g1_i10.p5  ORF type:complete len:132 (-),score=18.59 TRINITY_DN1807_c0_g1_i10:781-1176(-)
MSEEIDEKDRQTFLELQKRYATQRTQHKSIQQQILREDKIVQTTQLTKTELSKYPDDVRSYNSVGRAYFLQDKKSVLDSLSAEEYKAKENLSALNKSKENSIKGIDSSEKELREFLSTKPALAKRIATHAM